VWFTSLILALPAWAGAGGGQQSPADSNTADIIFQSMCSGGGTKGILDVNFPVKISWRCSKCGRKTEVTVPLVKTDNTDSIAKKIAGAINGAVAGSSHVSVTYYQSSQTNRQNQNWYRIRFTGVDQVDAGAWHSKLKIYVITWPGVRYVAPGPLPENVTPGKPGRTVKPGKELRGEKKKREYTDPNFFGWKEVQLSVGLHPWSKEGQVGAFVPYRSYRLRCAESEPDGLLFDQIESVLVADRFQVRRLDDTHLALLGGPEGTIVTMLSFGTYLSDPVRRAIDQEEHWTIGGIVSSTDEEPVRLTAQEEAWLRDRIQTGLSQDLSRWAGAIALREGLVPWTEYPDLLAQEPWRPSASEPEPILPGDVFIDLSGNLVPLTPDFESPDPAYTYSGCVTTLIELNFRAHLIVVVTPASPSYGTWTGTVVPDIVGPGEAEVEICVRGENVDLSALPAGSRTIAATVTLQAAPVGEPW
jgi:hypothetical protein